MHLKKRIGAKAKDKLFFIYYLSLHINWFVELFNLKSRVEFVLNLTVHLSHNYFLGFVMKGYD